MSDSSDPHDGGEPAVPDEPDCLLDAGLRAGFAGLTPRDVAENQVPPADAEGAEPSPSSRYVIESELGAGGMGRVLRARDRVMGRLVALKVMSPAAPPGSARVERFWEEAQIASQLQHPSIVPIYDLGRSSSLQPYFTMKLVEGATLRERLSRRPNPEHERQRFLGWFLQACQAAAFAHAQGVVHRDLKPSNMMIGEFGELHVMDWGLAKIVGSEGGESGAGSPVRTLQGSDPAWHTRTGGAVGTPSYMAPEQAAGRGARADPRADVFSLGVILLEILSGESLAGRGAQIVAEGRIHQEFLEAARSRLRILGVDEDLASIACDCLASNPQHRPPDAGALAACIQDWMGDVEQRLRAAELAAHASEVRVGEQRRRTRLQLGYASVLAALLLIGGLVYLDWSQRRERQRAETARAVSEAIQVASAARGRAEAAATEAEALAACAEAEQAASRAQDIARTGAAGEDILRHSHDAVASITEVTARIRARLEHAQREREVVERIEQLRALPAIRWEMEGARGDYAGVFRSLGIDVESLDTVEAARRIRGSGIVDSLLGALDDWIMSFQDWRGLDSTALDPRCTKLLDVAQASDGNEARRAVRAALRDRDIDALGELAAGSALEDALPSTVMLVGRALGIAGGPAAAVSFLKRLHHLRPDDFWINLSLAFWLRRIEPPRPQGALVHGTAAVAALPRSAPARLVLGRIYHLMGAREAALAHFEAAVSLHPTYAYAHMIRGEELLELDRLDEAEGALSEALRLDPGFADTHAALAQLDLRRSRPAAAVAAASEAVKLAPRFAGFRHLLGVALESDGQFDAAEASLREALEIDAEDAVIYGALAQILRKTGRRREAVLSYREALRRDADRATWHYNLGNLLAAGEDFLGAETSYLRALELDPGHAPSHLNLGQALRCQGRFEEALESLRRGQALQSGSSGAAFPSSAAIRQCETALEVERRLVDVLGGEHVPGGEREWVVLAWHCGSKRHYAQEARVWQLAFEADPDLAEGSRDAVRYRFRAAAAALRAGLGEGMDGPVTDVAARLRWQTQARCWLREELDAMLQLLSSGPRARDRVGSLLTSWLESRPISEVRTPAVRQALAESEREAWSALLAAIEAARDRCEE